MAPTSHPRPTGMAVLAFVLLWFSLSAVGNLFVSSSMRSLAYFPPGSPAASFAKAVASPLFVMLVACYGLAALVAAVATWRMSSWAPRAFLCWSVAAVALGTFFLAVVPTELLWGGRPAAAAVVLGVAVALWFVYRYVRRVTYGGASAAL